MARLAIRVLTLRRITGQIASPDDVAPSASPQRQWQTSGPTDAASAPEERCGSPPATRWPLVEWTL